MARKDKGKDNYLRLTLNLTDSAASFVCVLPGLGTETTAAEIELPPSTATSREAIVKAAARLMMECEPTLTALALRNAQNAKTSAWFFVDYAVSNLQVSRP